ncbi:MAG: hypothetical protein ACFB4I_17990 [Cyanophyceae cyanobacterium]
MTQPQKSEREPKNELKKLNQWLADPILRTEVMARVVKGDRYSLEFDEHGQAKKVVGCQDRVM